MDHATRTETAFLEEDVRFAEGRSFYKMALIFIIGCLVGTWYEEILHYVRHGFYESRSGVLYGPFNPVYGAGYLLMLLFLSRFSRWYVVIAAGAVLGGAFEYLLSLGQEFFTGQISWNYHGRFLNIHGRTTVPYMLFWGILGYVMVKIVYPVLSDIIEKIPPRMGRIVTLTLFWFLVVNMAVSYTALLRQGMRHRGIEPLKPIGEFYDRVYDDERIYRSFPDMEPADDMDGGD